MLLFLSVIAIAGKAEKLPLPGVRVMTLARDRLNEIVQVWVGRSASTKWLQAILYI